MFIWTNFVLSIAQILNFILWAYMWIVIISALMTWIEPNPYNPIVRFLHRATEPVLRPIRRRLPDMPIDFSPMIVIIAIIFLQRFLVKTLYQLAYSLG